MNLRKFEVPAEFVGEFAEMLAERRLVNEVKGTNNEGDVIIEVAYTSNQKSEVYDLMEWCEEFETEEEVDEDDDEDDTSIDD